MRRRKFLSWMMCGACLAGGCALRQASVGDQASMGDAGDGGASSGSSGGSAGEDAGGGPCTPPRIVCDGQCVDPRTDPNNCGICEQRCATYIPEDGFQYNGECIDGLCNPSFAPGNCGPWGYNPNKITCNDLCNNGPERCVENGCFGGTVLWEAGYKDERQEEPCIGFDCPEVPTTLCRNEHPEYALVQSVGCDVPLDEALAMSGLPPRPPIPPGYEGWTPYWTTRCCCQLVPSGD